MARRRTEDDGNMFYGMVQTDEQKMFKEAIMSDEKQIVFCDAIAGSGKTTIAVGCANILHDKGRYDGMLYLVATPYEDIMGFRPGTQVEKEMAYMAPLFDACETLNQIPERCIEEYAEISNITNGNVWISAKSINFLRGTNVMNKVVVIDEAQNMTARQLKTVQSRMHDTSKVICIGHHGQIDIRGKSGFVTALEHYRDQEYCEVCEQTKNFRGKISRHADDIPE